MTARLVLLLAAALAACSQPPPPEPPYRVVERVGPMVFMLMGPTMPRAAHAWQDAARDVCGAVDICNVKIWTDPRRVAQGFPMTDLEADAIEAAYLVNRSTGADGFVCHPFGQPRERCR